MSVEGDDSTASWWDNADAAASAAQAALKAASSIPLSGHDDDFSDDDNDNDNDGDDLLPSSSSFSHSAPRSDQERASALVVELGVPASAKRVEDEVRTCFRVQARLGPQQISATVRSPGQAWWLIRRLSG